MRQILFILIAFMTLIACNESQKNGDKGTIFMTEFDTPFGKVICDHHEVKKLSGFLLT